MKLNEWKCKVLQLGCNSPHSGMGEELTGWKRGSQGAGEQRAGQGQWCALTVKKAACGLGCLSKHTVRRMRRRLFSLFRPHCCTDEPKTGGSTRQTLTTWSKSGKQLQDGWGLEHMTYKERLKEVCLMSSREKIQSGSSHSLQVPNGKA